MSRFIISLTLVLLCFSLVAQARQITFINSCSFPISVTGSGQIVCNNVSPYGGSCTWGIPSAGWVGRFYRYNYIGDKSGYPSATLAEFNLAKDCSTCAWNYDWYDISIIPPGCPGSSGSYSQCVALTNPPGVTTNDGYDVGMEIVPSLCSSQTKICDGKGCSDAYGFPSDTKTAACTQLGDWQVTFCPSGSFVDLNSAEEAVADATTESSGDSSMSSGIGIGIGVGIGALVVLLVVGVVLMFKKKKSLEVV